MAVLKLGNFDFIPDGGIYKERSGFAQNNPVAFGFQVQFYVIGYGSLSTNMPQQSADILELCFR
jgi:hypothetical protein